VRFTLEVAGRLRVVSIEPRNGSVAVSLDGSPLDVDVARLGPGRFSLRLPGSGRQHDVTIGPTGPDGRVDVSVGGAVIPVTRRTGQSRHRHGGGNAGDGRLTAPMPGKVVRVLVKPGDAVSARQGVVVVEAMKMENELRAGRDGVVREVLVEEGASVEAGAPLVVIG
jgi:biotin carboxyl carrier protein